KLDRYLSAERQRRNIVHGGPKPCALADSCNYCWVRQKVEHQINCVDSCIVESVGPSCRRVKFPACISGSLVEPKTPLHCNMHEFAECAARDDVSELSDSGLMSQMMGKSERVFS